MSANDELPREWRQTTVDESIKIIDYRGRTPPFDGTAIPHLRSQNVKSGRIVWNDLAYVSEGTYSAFMTRGIPQTGDILFTTEAPLGEVAPVPEQRFSVAQRIMVLRPSPEIWSPHFLMYQLMSPEVQARIRRKGTGSTVTGVAARNFKPLTLRVAPLPEQRRIVAEIEKQFTRLEAGVAALRRVQANLKRYRAAVLKAACEGRLVPTEAELHKVAAASRRSAGNKQSRDGSATFETGAELLTRILAERRKNWTGRGNYKEPAAPDTANLPPLPEGWTWATIEHLRVFSLYGPRFSSDDYAEDGYIVLRTTDISASGKVDASRAPRLKLSKEDFERYRAKRGDLLVTRTGSLGTLAIFDDDVEAIPGAYLIQFRLATEPVTTRYLFFLLKSPIGQSYLTGKGAGVGRPNLNAPTIEALPVPIPPLAEQTRIVAEVERRLSVVEELESVVSANLQRATRLRQSILQKAFTGGLV